MRLLTFAEFFDLPPGVLFSQLPGLPHDNPGLYLKGDSWSPVNVLYLDGPGVAIVDLTDVRDDDGSYGPLKPRDWNEIIYGDGLDDGHRFAVYEAAELGFLAGVVGRARLATGA